MLSSSFLRIIALGALAVVAALTAVVSPASAKGRTTVYTLPDEFALPNDLTTGPDGAVWVTDSSLGRIWRITVKGKIRSYELGDMPGGITTAYGSMWVTDSGGDAIHRVETDGSSTRIPLREGAFPLDIVEGSDGALWFTAAAAVGRITTAGVVTEHAMPGLDALPRAIVAGPGGALYVADGNNDTIDRMTTAGAFTDLFALPREHAGPTALAAGPRALYISENGSGVVSRMTYDGRFTNRYRIPGGFPESLIVGPDSALWINQSNFGKVVRLDIQRRARC